MRFVALLRGINVGGKNPVPMAELKAAFEDLGHTEVRTYLNSGNVVFDAPRAKPATLADALAADLAERYPFAPRVLVVRGTDVTKIAADLPREWLEDEHSSCNVAYLFPELATPKVLDRFDPLPGLEDLRYSHGALLSRVSHSALSRSAFHKMQSTDAIQQMTVRNANTARKLAELVAGSRDQR